MLADDPREYIHRVGRTARGSNGKGRSLMFLQPSEVGFLTHLKTARVPVVEFEFPSSKIVSWKRPFLSEGSIGSYALIGLSF